MHKPIFCCCWKRRIGNFVNKKFELKVEKKCFSKERFVWSRLSFFSLWQPCKQLFRPNRWSGFEAGLGPNYRLFRQFQNPDRQPLRNRRQHLLPGRESVRSKKDYKWWSQLNRINFWILLISSRYCLLHWFKSRILKQCICIIHILVEIHHKWLPTKILVFSFSKLNLTSVLFTIVKTKVFVISM